MSEESERKGGISRRDVITRGAIAGGALIWAAPMVTGVTPAFAAAASPPPCEPHVVGATITYQDSSGTRTDFATVSIGFEELCNCDVKFANWAGKFNGNSLSADQLPPATDQVAVFKLTGGGDFPAGTFEFDTDLYACCNGVVTGATHIHIVDVYAGSGSTVGNPTVTTSASSAGNLTCP